MSHLCQADTESAHRRLLETRSGESQAAAFAFQAPPQCNSIEGLPASNRWHVGCCTRFVGGVRARARVGVCVCVCVCVFCFVLFLCSFALNRFANAGRPLSTWKELPERPSAECLQDTRSVFLSTGLYVSFKH